MKSIDARAARVGAGFTTAMVCVLARCTRAKVLEYERGWRLADRSPLLDPVYRGLAVIARNRGGR